MSRFAFHHVTLAIPVDGLAAEQEFLTQVLGYTPIERQPPRANWFEAADGSQLHLSLDPDYRAPAGRNHTALAFGSELGDVESRLSERGIEYDASRQDVLLCRDPNGNLWELRGEAPDGWDPNGA